MHERPITTSERAQGWFMHNGKRWAIPVHMTVFRYCAPAPVKAKRRPRRK